MRWRHPSFEQAIDASMQDLRNLSKEFLHIHHSFAIRTVMFSPSILEPLHAITGLDSGSMCR